MDGLERLTAALEEMGSDGLVLPAETVSGILVLSKQHGIEFDHAWNVAINRVSPPAEGGYINPDLRSEVYEQRELIAECKPHFRAAYHGTAPDPIEVATARMRTEARLADLNIGNEPRVDPPPGVAVVGVRAVERNEPALPPARSSEDDVAA